LTKLELLEPFVEISSAEGTSIRRTLLPNGIRVLTETVPAAPSVAIAVSVSVGSRDEKEGQFGSTHFLEHLLFKGTNKRSAKEIAEAFDSVGASSNAATAKEYTSYYARVQNSALPLAVEVLSDMVTGSVLDSQEFELERTVILEELAMVQDDPEDVAHETSSAAVLGENDSLGRPIGGTPETIKAVSRDDVYSHYRANYRPQDLVITAAGGVDHQELLELVTRELSRSELDTEQLASPERRLLGTREFQPEKNFVSVNKETQQANVAISMPGISAMDDRRYAMGVLNTILGGGMSSRLFQEIREKRGLAYSVYSFNQGYSDAGLFGMFAGTSPKNASQVAQLMHEQLLSIANHGVSDGEFELARGNIAGGLALRFESSQARMNRLLAAELSIGEFIDLESTLESFNQVSKDEIQQLAVSLANSSKALVVVGDGNFDSMDGLVS
jgi:predicted Zn-dependent peptidase